MPTGKELGMTNLKGRMLTAREVAALLRVSERWVQHHMNSKTLPLEWYPINSKSRIVDSAVLDKWLAQIKVPAGEAPMPEKAIRKIKNERRSNQEH
jgi:predicted DNA-binding transcriptional regulator AlpA